MSASPRPPIPSLIPESAPFTLEQRTWLNGLFAGLFGLSENVTPVSNADAARLLAGLLDGTPAADRADAGGAAEVDDAAPWHDPVMPLPDRMKLAEGRPLPRRLMAAMAQQDCGQCGYNCKDYADALFAKSEKRLNLCVPGGKDTSRMLKQLYQELDSAPAAPAAVATIVPEQTNSAPAPLPGRSRDNPVYATFLSRRRLNKPGSEKETWHVDIDLAGTDLDYFVGDSFGIFPANDHDLVAAILAALDVPADFPIGDRTFAEVLTDGVSLSPAPDMLFELISYLTGGERRQKAERLAAGEDPDGDAATLDVLAALHKFPGIRPDPEAFIETLDVLQPRVYSISSSHTCNPGRVSLTVDAVRYQIDKRTRLGVCSTFLGGRVVPGDKIRVYVQKAQHFALPNDPSKPIIMIGPGTGIAPFRAFLQERQAIKAPGRNWLFFGHQRSDCDFFYEEELASMRAAGLLTRLTLAWSRDGREKTYVQHRMREVGRDLWSWLNDGAHVYVCGDAMRMAKDVESVLTEIVAQQGGCTPAEAVKFVAELKAEGRYQADVY
jgi:sulfite reductase (NADPH) flavoprotein alpha-component